MNSQKLNLYQTPSAAIIVQHSQTKSTTQPDYNLSYLAGIFVTFMVVGMALGCFLRYKKCKKHYERQIVEIYRQIENLDKIQKMTTEVEQNMTSQRKKQIEALEEIWKKNP